MISTANLEERIELIAHEYKKLGCVFFCLVEHGDEKVSLSRVFTEISKEVQDAKNIPGMMELIFLVLNKHTEVLFNFLQALKKLDPNQDRNLIGQMERSLFLMTEFLAKTKK